MKKVIKRIPTILEKLFLSLSCLARGHLWSKWEEPTVSVYLLDPAERWERRECLMCGRIETRGIKQEKTNGE